MENLYKVPMPLRSVHILRSLNLVHNLQNHTKRFTVPPSFNGCPLESLLFGFSPTLIRISVFLSRVPPQYLVLYKVATLSALWYRYHNVLCIFGVKSSSHFRIKPVAYLFSR